MKPQGTEIRWLSSLSAQVEIPTCEDRTSSLEQVLERTNMLRALIRVESNKGAPGVDGVDVKSLRNYIIDNWAGIRQQLLLGTYKPQPVRRVEISKPGGGKRGLRIPTVVGRPLQQALLQVLTPISTQSLASTVTAFVLDEAHMMHFTGHKDTSKRATDGLWTWTWRSSLTV